MWLKWTLSPLLRMASANGRLAVLAAILVIVSACSQQEAVRPAVTVRPAADATPYLLPKDSISIDGNLYNDTANALRAVQAQLDNKLERVRPADIRLGGRALLILPTMLAFEKYPTTPLTDKRDWVNRYLVGSDEASALAEGTALERAGLFDVLELLRSDAPGSVPTAGYDYVLTVVKDKPGRASWYIRHAGGPDTEVIAVPPRYRTSLRWQARQVMIVNAAADLGVNTVRRPLPNGISNID